MSFQATCPQCGKSGQVPDSLAGKRIRCPQCKSTFRPHEAGEEQASDRRSTSSKSLVIRLVVIAAASVLFIIVAVIFSQTLFQYADHIDRFNHETLKSYEDRK